MSDISRLKSQPPQPPLKRPEPPAAPPKAPETADVVVEREDRVAAYEAGKRAAMPFEEHVGDELPELPESAREALEELLDEPDARATFDEQDADGDGVLTKSEVGDDEAFARADADADGLVSLSEHLATAEANAKFDELDSNGNGHLASDEIEDQEAFMRADADGDGKVTRDEYAAEAQRQHAIDMDFKRHDTDGDGHLASDEIEDQGLFREVDADGDGKITREEHAAYIEASSTVPADPAGGSAAEPTSSYVTAYPHPVDELASQLGFTSTDEMLAANPGLAETPGYPNIPAGTPIQAPASNGDVQSQMQALDAENGGGHYTPPADPNAQPGTPAGTATAQPGDPVAATPGDPNSYFMTQFTHEKWNPNGPNSSANCGPTSLAMALKAFGVQPPGLTDPNDPEAWIDATRMAMMGHTDDHAYSDTGQIIAGAQAVGVNAEPVGFEGLDAALASGKLVVAAGNPAVYNSDWQETGTGNSEYDGGHFILVTGKDANGNYLINDPLSHVGSIAVSPAELQAYFGYQGWNSGVAIWP